MKFFVTTLFFLLALAPAHATDYYVRTDGGTSGINCSSSGTLSNYAQTRLLLPVLLVEHPAPASTGAVMFHLRHSSPLMYAQQLPEHQQACLMLTSSFHNLNTTQAKAPSNRGFSYATSANSNRNGDSTLLPRFLTGFGLAPMSIRICSAIAA